MTMMTNRKKTLREKASSAMERLDKTEARLGDVEQNHAKLAMATNQVLNKAFTESSQLKEVVEGLIDLLGDVFKPKEGENAPTFFEALESKLKQRHMGRQVEEASRVKGELEKQVAEGNLIPVETVEAGCIVTGTEYDKEGQVTHPGYVAISWDRLKPEYQEQLNGKNVGFKLTTDTGSFEIGQILKPVTKENEVGQA